ncbi:hypothetical protein [Caloranaerobacter ferrireducens]|uniref:hypothetical protein n=1 Tax=Caloranaerobacter ferrireducens TaxID=1323370 RepID=UPI00084DC265|nr:hypothetical protein [Caloranaerobacter ferrireducens]
MKKIVKKQNRLSREILANPFPNETLRERLVNSKVIDYKDNCILEDFGNGYMRISPKDEKKLLRL